MGKVLLPPSNVQFKKVLIGKDAFEVADKKIASFIMTFVPLFGIETENVTIASDKGASGTLSDWSEIFCKHQVKIKLFKL